MKKIKSGTKAAISSQIEWESITPETVRTQVASILMGHRALECLRDQYGQTVLLKPGDTLTSTVIKTVIDQKLLHYLPLPVKVVDKAEAQWDLLRQKAERLKVEASEKNEAQSPRGASIAAKSPDLGDVGIGNDLSY